MKQLGNLAVVCAQRRGVLLQIMDGKATLFVGEGPACRPFTTNWGDDEQINRLIHELNFGTLSEEVL